MIRNTFATLAILAAIAAIATMTTSSVYATTMTPPQERDQGQHGSAAADFTGQPADANNWGDLTSDRASTEHDIGQHSRSGGAPGDGPFDSDGVKGRIGIGNNIGDGPSGHGTCVDGIPDNDDPLC